MIIIKQVAEMGAEKEMVGIIRGCIKTVTSGTRNLTRFNNNGTSNSEDDDDHFAKLVFSAPICTKLAYILGLRVSPSHRSIYNSIINYSISDFRGS